MKELTERHVQAIWYDSAYRPANLVTRRGTAVRVVSPGEWNLGAGPDFRGAVLELGAERQRLTGDVEVHLCPADWDLHAHGADPEYRNVIAHVTWRGGPEPASLPSGAVSIWLGRLAVSDPSFHPDMLDLSAYPFDRLPLGRRPCEKLLGDDPDRAREVILSAGRHRLTMKARRMEGRLSESGADGRQIYYEELMTAFGYSHNTVPFRRVAMRVPVASVEAEPECARAAMVAAASFEEWDNRATRPWNAPEQRLASAADVVVATPAMELSGAADFTPHSSREMVRSLCSRRSLGVGRAAAIVANVVAPFAMASGRLREPPGWLPPEDISSPVRLTAFRLLGRDHNPAAFYAGNGVMIQGLLQIHRLFCERVHPDCFRCRVAARDAFRV